MELTVESINRQINYWTDQYEQAKANNNALNERIAELDAAIAYVDTALSDARTYLKETKKLGEDTLWCGRRKNTNSSYCSYAVSTAENLKTSISNYKSQIKSERWALKSQVNVLVQLISSAENTINDLTDALSNLFD